MRRVTCTVVLLTCLPVTARAQQAISPQLVTAIKAATVFVKIKAEDMAGSGSGFVISVDGNTAYIVTNRHVVEPKIVGIEVVPDRRLRRPARRECAGAGRGFPQPMVPSLPFQPGFPGTVPQQEEPRYSARLVVREFRNVQVTAIFQSGMKQEESAHGSVVAVDPEEDLAVVKVSGVKQALKPIKYLNVPEPAETTPIYVFGFPLGEDLATGKRNPAITVGKGSVSSLRTDDDGNLAVVQIDAALNHGNSGGPVVDAQGRLVGVAVARITEDESQNISFAVPSRAVARMTARPDRQGHLERRKGRRRPHDAPRHGPARRPARQDQVGRVPLSQRHVGRGQAQAVRFAGRFAGLPHAGTEDRERHCRRRYRLEEGGHHGFAAASDGWDCQRRQAGLSDNRVDSVAVAVLPKPVVASASPAAPPTSRRGTPNTPAPVVAGETHPRRRPAASASISSERANR